MLSTAMLYVGKQELFIWSKFQKEFPKQSKMLKKKTECEGGKWTIKCCGIIPNVKGIEEGQDIQIPKLNRHYFWDLSLGFYFFNKKWTL